MNKFLTAKMQEIFDEAEALHVTSGSLYHQKVIPCEFAVKVSSFCGKISAFCDILETYDVNTNSENE